MSRRVCGSYTYTLLCGATVQTLNSNELSSVVCLFVCLFVSLLSEPDDKDSISTKELQAKKLKTRAKLKSKDLNNAIKFNLKSKSQGKSRRTVQ